MTALETILQGLVRQVASCPPDIAESWVRRHRLEPLVYGIPVEGVSWRDAFMESCRESYARMAARAEQYRIAGASVVQWLAEGGVPAFIWRGVEAGAALYGDPAVRYATDIDVMVRPADAERALALLRNQGCSLRTRNTPVWYVRRHHLHWPLNVGASAIPVDVHWSVDNPYHALPVDLDWMELATPEGRLQLAIHHAMKESRFRGGDAAGLCWARMVQAGPLLPWVDLALMVEQAGDGVVDRARVAMQQRGHGDRWHCALAMVDRLCGRCEAELVVGGVSIPSALAPRWVLSQPAKAVAFWLGCRPEALSDVRHYLAGHRDAAAAPSVGVRLFRLTRLAVDTLVCGLWIGLRQMGQRLRMWGVPC